MSIAIVVVQGLDVVAPGNDDAALRVERHRIDVVSQVVRCEQRYVKALGRANADGLFVGRVGTSADQRRAEDGHGGTITQSCLAGHASMLIERSPSHKVAEILRDQVWSRL
jgi:hypothetical protein